MSNIYEWCFKKIMLREWETMTSTARRVQHPESLQLVHAKDTLKSSSNKAAVASVSFI